MNCRPGDLAIVVGGSQWAGWLVRVIEAAPTCIFRLPDGLDHHGVPPGWWVIESLCRRFEVPGNQRSYFGAGCDKRLRPIRAAGEDARDETLCWLGAPAGQATSE